MLDPPDRTALESLHTRLCCGDRVASSELVRILLPYLSATIVKECPRADEQFINDGVVDALLEYCTNPGQFDPTRGVPLESFLRTAARRNVANRLRSERRRKERERKVGSEKREFTVADDPIAGNIRQEDLVRLAERREAILATLTNQTDRDVINLWMNGVRDSSAYAAALRLTHLSIDEQRAEVKRQKERLLRLLRRKGLIS